MWQIVEKSIFLLTPPPINIIIRTMLLACGVVTFLHLPWSQARAEGFETTSRILKISPALFVKNRIFWVTSKILWLFLSILIHLGRFLTVLDCIYQQGWKNAAKRRSSMQGSNDGRLQLKVVFHRRSSSNNGCLPTKDVFHRRSSTTEGRLPTKVVFLWRLSSTEDCLPPKVVFHRRSSSTEGRLPLMVVFHWR